MTLLMGHNEAETRVKAMLHQTNKGGIDYPSATNNRGQGGREAHADGDMVGGGHDGNDDDSERHASGGMCGSSLPSQGGHYRSSNFHSSSEMPSQGGSHMKPMSGYTKPPKVRATYKTGGDVRDQDREKHGWGSLVGGAFNKARSTAQNLGNQGLNYAKQQGAQLNNQAQNYVKQQANHLANQGQNYASQQLGKASERFATPSQPNPTMMSPQQQPQVEPMKRGGQLERQNHNFGSFVKSVGKGMKSVAKAAAPYAKEALKQGARGAAEGAASGAMKRGGRTMMHRGGNR